MFATIEKSSYGTLPSYQNLEIDRIVSKEKENTVLQLRIRNTSSKPVQIFSFVIVEFILPQKVEKVLENGWLQCSEVRI